MTGDGWFSALSRAAHSVGDHSVSGMSGALVRWSYGTRTQVAGVRLDLSGGKMRYGINGEPISADEWSALFENEDYRRVMVTTVLGKYDVSTVWLGLDHSFGASKRPLIFETCVFSKGRPQSSWVVKRYPTKDSARRGHNRVVKQLKEGVDPADLV